jgi:hypothetical protein
MTKRAKKDFFISGSGIAKSASTGIRLNLVAGSDADKHATPDEARTAWRTTVTPAASTERTSPPAFPRSRVRKQSEESYARAACQVAVSSGAEVIRDCWRKAQGWMCAGDFYSES